MKVFVYFNLHRKCLSVRAMEGPRKGRVIRHVNSIVLSCATFKVSEAGRQRVLRERRKNVHAGIVGYDNHADVPMHWGDPVKYNPYKYTSFVHAINETPVHAARMVEISARDGRASILAQLTR